MKIKRFLLVLLGGLLGNTLLFAQLAPPTLRGKATQEMTDEGFVVATPSSYPLDSRVKIINIETGKELIATVAGRILPSPNRIVDLSRAAWDELELNPESIVNLASYTPPPPEISRPAEPLPIPEPETARWDFSQPLYHLLVLDRSDCLPDSDIDTDEDTTVLYRFSHGKNGYLIALYTALEGPTFPLMPDESRIMVSATATRKVALREYINSTAFRRFVANPTILSQLRKALEDIKIIPALPHANSDKVYRIQVGAFAQPETAAVTARILTNAGFLAAAEQYGALRRITTEGMPAAEIAAAVQRLEFAGFREVWIRE